VTTTFPLVAPTGTVTVTVVVLQVVAVALVPLNLTALLPCEEPKLVPLMITCVPGAPDAGLIPMIAGPVLVLLPLPLEQP
jgi:hypothetical protein